GSRGGRVADVRRGAGWGAAEPVRLLFRDQALRQQLLEARIERAVAKGTEGTEERVQSLAQFVTVHGSLVQQAEHGQLEHSRPVTTAHDSPTPPAAYLQPHPGRRCRRRYTSNRCIEPI